MDIDTIVGLITLLWSSVVGILSTISIIATPVILLKILKELKNK